MFLQFRAKSSVLFTFQRNKQVHCIAFQICNNAIRDWSQFEDKCFQNWFCHITCQHFICWFFRDLPWRDFWDVLRILERKKERRQQTGRALRRKSTLQTATTLPSVMPGINPRCLCFCSLSHLTVALSSCNIDMS